jgi:hypothetical protein
LAGKHESYVVDPVEIGAMQTVHPFAALKTFVVFLQNFLLVVD